MGGYGQLALAREAGQLPMMGNPQGVQQGMAGALTLAQLLQNTQQQRQLFPGQLQGQQQELQMRNMAIQQAQQEQQDRSELQRAYTDAQGNPDSFLKNLQSPSYSISVPNRQKTIQGVLATAQKYAGLSPEQIAKQKSDADSIDSFIGNVTSAPAANRAAIWPIAVRALAARGVDTSSFPQQYPGDDQFQLLKYANQTHQSLLKEQPKVQTVAPGASLGTVTPTGQFTPTYTARAKPEKVDDQQQYIQDWLATRNLPNTPANRQKAFDDYNKKTKVEPGVARLQVLLNRPTQVADPNNPGETVMVPGTKSYGMAGPSSASVQNPRAMGRYMTSGKGGQQLAMFDTAIGHAQQLGQAIDALNNGNIRGLNAIGNRLGMEFGADAVTNFNVVKNALTAEVERLFSGGVASEGDRRQMAAPISAANSPQQLRGAIQQVIHLMNSRRDALQKQYSQGMQGQPNFGAPGGNGGGKNYWDQFPVHQ